MEIKYRLPNIRLTIENKLLLGVFAILLLLTTIVVVGIISINNLEKTSYEMLVESSEQNAAQKLKLSLQELLMPPNDYLIHGNNLEIENFDYRLAMVYAQIDENKRLLGSEYEKSCLEKAETSLNEIQMMARMILSLEEPVGNSEGAKVMEIMDAMTNKAIKEIDEVLIESTKEMDEYIKINQATYNQINRTIILSGFIIAFILLIGGFLYVKNVIKPIDKIAQALQKVSSGELSSMAKIATQDEFRELAESFNNMIGVLEKTTISRSYFNNIISRMTDTLIITDSKGIITNVNQVTLDLLGYTEKEIIGMPFGIVLSEESDKEVCISNTVMQDLVKNEHVHNVYNIYFSKDREKIPVSFSSSLTHDKKGIISGMICVANNVAKKNKKEIKEKDDRETGYIRTVGEIPLTNREREIMKLIVDEFSNSEIANKLYISSRTVETHRKNIMQKLHTKSVIALVKYAIQNETI